jgi:putative ubiquitin-RnfH superfamily antitoxin RatB of RatAB toxin-antitoxin module
MTAEKTIAVFVAFATPARQWQKKIILPAGASVRDAIAASGLRDYFPSFSSLPENGDDNPVGVYGRRCAPDARLQDGDRVELYRPLPKSPPELRRLRAAACQSQSGR